MLKISLLCLPSTAYPQFIPGSVCIVKSYVQHALKSVALFLGSEKKPFCVRYMTAPRTAFPQPCPRRVWVVGGLCTAQGMKGSSIRSLRAAPAVIWRQRAMNSRMPAVTCLRRWVTNWNCRRRSSPGVSTAFRLPRRKASRSASREMQPMPRPLSTARLIASVCSSSRRMTSGAG